MTQLEGTIKQGMDGSYQQGRRMGQLDIVEAMYDVLKQSSTNFWDEGQLWNAVKAVCERYRNQP